MASRVIQISAPFETENNRHEISSLWGIFGGTSYFEQMFPKTRKLFHFYARKSLKGFWWWVVNDVNFMKYCKFTQIQISIGMKNKNLNFSDFQYFYEFDFGFPCSKRPFTVRLGRIENMIFGPMWSLVRFNPAYHHITPLSASKFT